MHIYVDRVEKAPNVGDIVVGVGSAGKFKLGFYLPGNGNSASAAVMCTRFV